MRNLKVFLALGAGLAAAVVAACSSSSSGNPVATGTQDGGDDGSLTDDGNTGPASCEPVGALTCTTGQTCCFDITTISGTCVAAGSCTKPIQVACSGGSSCGASQKCCANFGGASLAAVEDGGLGALGIDASALSAEAGISQLGSALGGLMIDVSCKAACDPNTEAQECDKDSDCSGGARWRRGARRGCGRCRCRPSRQLRGSLHEHQGVCRAARGRRHHVRPRRRFDRRQSDRSRSD
jgi:hypothetical protein